MKKDDSKAHQMPLFRTVYSARDRRYKVSFPEPSRTIQDAKDECDVNKILERYMRTGVLEHVRDSQPQFGDWSSLPPDYLSAQMQVIRAQDTFAKLPAVLREKFDNNSLNFLNFVTNPKNAKEMIALGLATARPEPSSTSSDAPKSSKKQDPKIPVSDPNKGGE